MFRQKRVASAGWGSHPVRPLMPPEIVEIGHQKTTTFLTADQYPTMRPRISGRVGVTCLLWACGGPFGGTFTKACPFMISSGINHRCGNAILFGVAVILTFVSCCLSACENLSTHPDAPGYSVLIAWGDSAVILHDNVGNVSACQKINLKIGKLYAP